MKVYFVRHGQSIFNKSKFKNKTHQFPETPLSDEGIKQAKFTAKRFTSVPIDIILASPYTRAHDTAKYINEVVNKKIELSNFLTERKGPSIFRGKDADSPEIQDIKKQIYDHRNEKDWHYSDEENFYDFKKRIDEFLKKLSMREEENILVVTHGYVLSMSILLMLLDDKLTPDIYFNFINHAHTSNTGITLCEYNTDKWFLHTWNDYAHLGE